MEGVCVPAANLKLGDNFIVEEGTVRNIFLKEGRDIRLKKVLESLASLKKGRW